MPITDDGMRFFATIRPRGGGEDLLLMPTDRQSLLAFIDAHLGPEDHLMIGTEATGSAAVNMLAAIRLGATKMETR